MAGLVARYFPDELLRQILDPRNTRGRTWKCHLPFLRAILLGLACGCHGFKEVEELTEDMTTSVRRRLGIPRRIPDTTLRDFACKLDSEQVSKVLYIVAYDAWRRKAFHQLEGFPFGVLSMDGKYPSVRDVGDEETQEAYKYLQVHHDKEGNASHGLIRTITSILATTVGRPILGAVPVLDSTNEMGGFQKAFGDMVRIYGRLFQVVMYDAGAASDPNAKAVRTAGKHYFIQIANAEWVMYQTMELLLRDKVPSARDEEQVSSRKCVVRELTMLPVKSAHHNRTLWEHTKTIFKVYSETYEDGELTGTKTRYFVSSMDVSALSAEKYLELVVLRWGVESAHQVLDTAFDEDKRPWITSDAQGALAIMIARRVVYTVLTLFKSVSQRSDENRQQPFRKIMEWIKDAMKMATDEDVKDLRLRKFAVPKALA
jgi:hypothetical protein